MRRVLVLMVALAASAAAPASAQAGPKHPVLQGAGDTVRIQLVDRASGRPIADSEVEVYADNGIRCVTTPCPTDGRSWHGRSDGKGIVAVPSSAINHVTHMGTTSHEMEDLARARADRSGIWVLRLIRKA